MEWAIGHGDEHRVWYAHTDGQEGDRGDDKSSSERQYVSIARWMETPLPSWSVRIALL